MFADFLFAERAMMHLPKFKRKKGKFNSRCPICGDSQTDMNKARFWMYEKKGDWQVHCFNCGYHSNLGGYLKDREEELYREWLLERRKENNVFKPQVKTIAETFTKKMPVIEKLNYCTKLDTLPENHPIVKYVANRKIPKSAYSRLWFTKEWQKLVNSISPETYTRERSECRLVIPIFDENGDIQSFQGRALCVSPNKYITIKAHEDASKIYGMDTIDGNRMVWLMEGPLDSLFIQNAGAITGGSLALNEVPWKSTRVWVLDNEPFHPDTCKRLSRLIDSGERVVMWDKCPWPSKDINDMIIKDGATPEEIEKYFKDNTVSGLQAKLRFGKWKRA
ncbi:DNA primase subunit [Aeromonas phage 44RR2.8t]|uniref:DNA primase subunit n=2 Tax=Biquartavirus 44RR2 TaxID=115987 RepID=Q6U9S2_9CAUD|nr:DNA primase [Aeromonas phage 44RR2.8t]AAQ81349.1 DNA primase subunit [Aeromonas phage 44RR2.8t]APU00503.1 DNA primase [Aeromonas phage 44RR2.8t.2]